jgi:ribonuclease Z
VANRELVVLGTASQAPTRHRNHNGYLLLWDGEGLLFDPGEGTQRQMIFAGATVTQITRICITHFHGDHCLGLPGVLQRMSLDRVPHVVDVCYPAESREVFTHLRHAALFRDAVRLQELPVHSGGTIARAESLFGIEVERLSHSVPTIGYRLVEPDGRRILADRLAAHGIEGPDIGRLQHQGHLVTGGQLVTLEEVSELKPGQRFAFIMDTRLCDAAFALADQADMLVCESTFANAEADLAQEYGHLTAGQAGRIAAESGARLLVLAHFSQRYDLAASQVLAEEAATAFGGEVVLAHDLDRIPVPRRLQPLSASRPAVELAVDDGALDLGPHRYRRASSTGPGSGMMGWWPSLAAQPWAWTRWPSGAGAGWARRPRRSSSRRATCPR